VTAEQQDLEALRSALYRPGATEEDRRRYAEALAARPQRPVDVVPLRRRRRRPLVLAVAGAVVILAGAAVAVGTLTRPAIPPYPMVASTPIALLGDEEDRTASREDLAALFDDSEPFLGLYLARHRTALSASLRTDSIAVDGRGTGPTTVSLAGIATPGQATGLMTVLLACDRRSHYSWVLTGPAGTSGRPVRTGAAGSDCGDGIVTATFVPKAGHLPARIRITVPEGVRTIIEVDLSKY
jgi:hypothetical protein